MSEQARSLKIKTGAVKRTTKELLYYHTEIEQEKGKLEKMEKEEADPYDIKQQQNVVQESAMMIPETKKSLEALVADLKSFMTEIGGAVDSASEESTQAAEVLAAAEKALGDAQPYEARARV